METSKGVERVRGHHGGYTSASTVGAEWGRVRCYAPCADNYVLLRPLGLSLLTATHRYRTIPHYVYQYGRGGNNIFDELGVNTREVAKRSSGRLVSENCGSSGRRKNPPDTAQERYPQGIFHTSYRSSTDRSTINSTGDNIVSRTYIRYTQKRTKCLK